jgi:hypothetical protein
MRLALEKDGLILELVRRLNRQNDYYRTNQMLDEIFKDSRCRLRLENTTRWGSTFLLLESIIKAPDRRIFDYVASVAEIHTIRTYLNILKAYLAMLQSNESCIEDLLPTLFNIIEVYESKEKSHNSEQLHLCALIADSLKSKFDYEINSEIYYVASILSTSKIQFWIANKYSNTIIQKGLKNLLPVAMKFLFKAEEANGTEELIEKNVETKKKGFLQLFFRKEKSIKVVDAARKFNFRSELEIEIKN